jgi:transposase
MRYDEHTRAHVLRRTTVGLPKEDIMRCLKRAIAREIYHEITHPQQT